MWRIRTATLAVTLHFALLLLGGCRTEGTSAWEQHAYIWSRIDAAGLAPVPERIRALRVLVAQWSEDADNPWLLDPGRKTGSHPVVAVVRLDGTAVSVPPATVVHAVEQRLSGWGLAHGLHAIEIDHDSATARLADYAHWLGAFREAWGTRSPVWITALPDWRRSAVLADLLDGVDSYTLQIHALDANSDRLIDHGKALDWIEQFEARTTTPYFIALPTYVLRVGTGADSSTRFVESASRVGAAATHEKTLVVDPADLASLATILHDTRGAQRRGIAWFRLPTPGDRSTISSDTFGALVAGGRLERKVEAGLVPVKPGTMTFDLILRNVGRHDTGLPRAIALADGCETGDTSGGYATAPDRRHLERTSQGLLPRGQTRPVGWIRCTSRPPGTPTVHW